MNNDRETWKIVVTVAGLMLAAVLIVPLLLGADDPATELITYTVQPGDTLYDLAAEYGVKDWRRWVDSTVKANHLAGSGLIAGREIVLEVVRPK